MPLSLPSPRPATPSTRPLRFHPKAGKVYVRPTQGRFSNWRWAVALATQLVFYGLCWLTWDGRQAVLFDLAERKFYLFGLVLWPQDGIYLALLLILAAMALFYVTTIAGRVFCGYACPQSVYTAIFLWIEQRVEGKRLARIERDAGPWNIAKLRVKLTKHGAWLALSAWTGLSFVGYFTPIRDLLPNAAQLAAGPWETFWIVFYAGFLYVQAGFLREMVCRHMCPYARFQGVMMDADTVTVTYDAARGEPRTGRRRREAAGAGGGDCVDCSLCVQVCPAGIDIRDGAQYECINCGLCIDGCDGVMDKIGRPRGLIRMASERELGAAHAAAAGPVASGLAPWSWRRFVGKLARPRALTYAALMLVSASAIGLALAQRVPLRVDILRDRGVLARETDDGRIDNVYLLKLMNMRETPHRLRIQVAGPEGLQVVGPDLFEVASGQVRAAPVILRLPRAAHASGPHPVAITIMDADAPALRVVERTSFLVP